MKIVVTDIEWDCHNKDVQLPTELVIDDPMVVPQLVEDLNEGAESLTNYLSDKYGYCIISLVPEFEGVDAK